MRNIVLTLLLLFGSTLSAVPPKQQPEIQDECLQGFPDWLLVDVLEAACEASVYFNDIGLEELLLYYHDGTVTIDYLGRDAVNPVMGRYRVVYGGGLVVIGTDDGL